MKQDELIQSLLDKMHAMFDKAIGPNNRSEYMQQHNVSGIDWHFYLSADDIIEQRVPRAVAGCTGISKVFSKLATEAGLKHVVLTTARMADLNAAGQDRKSGKKERIISGHQIIAVYDENGKLRAFDPGRKELSYIESEIQVGNIINFHFGGEVVPHCITAILTPQEFAEVDTYKKLRDLYVNGGGFMLDERLKVLKSRASKNFDKYMNALLDSNDVYMLPKERLSDQEWQELNSMLAIHGVKMVPFLHKDNYMYMKFTRVDKKRELENATAKIKVQQFNYIRNKYPNISDDVIKIIIDKQNTLDVSGIYDMIRHTTKYYKLDKNEFAKAVEYGSRDADGIKVFSYQNWTLSRRYVVRHNKPVNYHISLNVSVVPGLIRALDEVLKQDKGETIDYYKFPKGTEYNEAIARHDPVTIYLYSRNPKIEQAIVKAVAPYVRSNEGLLGEQLGRGVDINKETTDEYGMSVGQLVSKQIYDALKRMKQND